MFVTRTPIDPTNLLPLMGGSFCVTDEAELDGNRHVEIEGGNGRNVQVITDLGTGKVQAWLLGR